mgnify:FL=1
MDSITRRDFVRSSVAAGAVGAAPGTATASEGTAAERAIRILGISSSLRKGRTTAASLDVALQAAREVSDRVETELIELAEYSMPAGPAAGLPLDEGQRDDFPKLARRLADPAVRGIIIGTPVYFGNLSSLCKLFLERCIVLWRDDFALSGKVAGVVAVGGTRNGGQEVTLQSVQVSLLCQEMIVVGNGRPGPRLGATVWSGAKGGVLADEFGMTTTRALGRHVAETALRLAGER